MNSAFWPFDVTEIVISHTVIHDFMLFPHEEAAVTVIFNSP